MNTVIQVSLQNLLFQISNKLKLATSLPIPHAPARLYRVFLRTKTVNLEQTIKAVLKFLLLSARNQTS